MTTGSQSSPVQVHMPLDWQDLIDSARRSLTPPSAATRAAAHRAISTAYYAAYHALCKSNAEMIVGQPANQLSVDAWMRVYRGSSHRQATGNLERYRISLSPDGEAFAVTLGGLYNARIRADYNPRQQIQCRGPPTPTQPSRNSHPRLSRTFPRRTDRHRHHNPIERPLTNGPSISKPIAQDGQESKPRPPGPPVSPRRRLPPGRDAFSAP